MIIRTLADIKDGPLSVDGEGWTSRRLLVASDGMGFSLHDTLVYPGQPLHMQYANHLEAVYCIEGHGTITDCATGNVTELAPGVLYALNKHDEHIVEVSQQMRMVCVFNPPVTGAKVHDETGAFPSAANA